MENTEIYGIDKEVLKKSGADKINPYGNWEVKSYNYNGTTHYGFYTGHIADIALYIANVKSPSSGTYEPLTFSRINLIKPVLPSSETFDYTEVYFDIGDLNTVNCFAQTTAQLHEYIFSQEEGKELPFYSKEGNYQYKVILKNGRVTLHVITQEEKEQDKKLKNILSKLTEEEQKILSDYYS